MSLARRSALTFTAQIVSLGLAFAGSVIVSRVLGPEGRGVLSLLSVVVEMATGIATLGIGSAYAYLAGKGTHRMDMLIGSSLVLAGGLGLLSALATLLARRFLLRSLLQGLLPWHLALAAAAMPFAFLGFFLFNILLGSGRVRESALMQMFTTGLAVGAGAVALLVLRLGLDAMVVLFCATTAVSAVSYLALLVPRVGLSFVGVRAVARDALSYGLRAYLGSVTSYFWLRADVLILNAWAGPGAVGQYTLATSLGEKIWLLDSSVGRAVLPEVIASDERSAARLVARTSRNLLLVTGIPALLLAAAAPWLVPFVYGEAFSTAVLPLVLLLPGIVAIAMMRVISSYFSGQLGRPSITSFVSLATMTVGLASYLALIPPFGAAGAAAGSTLAYLVPFGIYVFLFPRTTGLRVSDMLLLNRDDRALYPRLLRRLLDSLAFRRDRTVTR